MAITDELREWAHGPDEGDDWLDRIDEFCDRIDAAHRAALEKLAAQMDETSGMREFCERLDRAANNREDVTIWGVDYTPLPVDADGVPIRPGDELVIFETGEHIRTYDIELYDDGRWLVCDDETMDSIHPDRLRHRAPTVEDVLREFAANIADVLGGDDFRLDDSDELYAEYAARLRLAGDGE